MNLVVNQAATRALKAKRLSTYWTGTDAEVFPPSRLSMNLSMSLLCDSLASISVPGLLMTSSGRKLQAGGVMWSLLNLFRCLSRLRLSAALLVVNETITLLVSQGRGNEAHTVPRNFFQRSSSEWQN